jgi:hypothetical protein
MDPTVVVVQTVVVDTATSEELVNVIPVAVNVHQGICVQPGHRMKPLLKAAT